MRKTEVAELKNKSISDLVKMVEKARKEIEKIRAEIILKKLADTNAIGKKRRSLAQILTILSMNKRESYDKSKEKE